MWGKSPHTSLAAIWVPSLAALKLIVRHRRCRAYAWCAWLSTKYFLCNFVYWDRLIVDVFSRTSKIVTPVFGIWTIVLPAVIPPMMSSIFWEAPPVHCKREHHDPSDLNLSSFSTAPYKNRLLHRKCAVRIFIHELQNFRNERVSVANEWVSKVLQRVNKIRTKHFLWCNLFIIY